MNDVFISYSRKDKEFVGRLRAALSELKREVWVDWEDIPLTADWWQEICAGIESSSNFVFVMTPDSLASPICALEVAHAVRHNKRLIPLMRAMVDETQMYAALKDRKLDDNTLATLSGRELLTVARENWQQLARHNWLFFQNDAEFPKNFESLMLAVDTDLDYAKDHTRLLVRASEWEKNNRNGSYILRGVDLINAEAWRASSAGKSPQPTELQDQYILASREAATRRQRMILGGVSVALVVAIGLTILSLILARRAEEQRVAASNSEATAVVALDQAEVNLRQAREAQTLFLANLANEESTNNRARQAFLLAQEGLQYYPDVYHQDNLHALSDALTAPGMEEYAIFHSNLVEVVWNQDKSRFLYYGDDVAVHDTASGEQLFYLPHAKPVMNALWNPSEQLLATLTEDGVQVWEDGELRQTLRFHSPSANLSWVDDTRLLAYTALETHLWDISSGTVIATTQRWITDWIETVGIEYNNDRVYLWDLAAGQQIFSVDSPSLYPLKDTENGRIIVAGLDGKISVWDVTSRQVTQTFSVGSPLDGIQLSDGLVYGWKVLPDGETTFIFVIDPETGESTGHSMPANLKHFNVVRPGYIETTGDSFYDVWDLENETLIFTVPLDNTQNRLWSPDYRYLATWGDDGAIRIWNYNTFQQHSVIQTGTAPIYVEWSGNSLLYYSAIRGVRLWNVTANAEIFGFRPDGMVNQILWGDDHILTAGQNTIQMWQIWPDPQWVKIWQESSIVDDVVWTDNYRITLVRSHANDQGDVTVRDLDTDELLFTLAMAEPVYAMELNPQKTRLLTRSTSGFTLWDMTIGEPLLEFADASYIIDTVWNVDGSRFVAWWVNLTDFTPYWSLAVYDGESGEQLSMLVENQELGFAGAGGVHWNSDGERLLSWEVEGQLRFWNTLTGEELSTIDYPDSLQLADWTPDGTKILTYGSNIRLWDAATGETVIEFEPLPFSTINRIGWNPDGTKFVAWAENQMVIGDTASGTFPVQFNVNGLMADVLWAGDKLVGWSNQVFVWDASTGEQLYNLSQQGRVNQVYVDGDKLLILSDNGTATIWQMSQEIARFQTGALFNGAVWNPGSSRLTTWGTDGTIREWRYDFEAIIEEAKSFSVRPLTEQERQQYFIQAVEEATPAPIIPTETITPLPSLTASPTAAAETPFPTAFPTNTPPPSLVDTEPQPVMEALVEAGIIPQISGGLALQNQSYSFDLDTLQQAEENRLLGNNTHRNFVIGGIMNWGGGAVSDYCGVFFRKQEDDFYVIELSRDLNQALSFYKVIDSESYGDISGLFTAAEMINLNGQNSFVIAALDDTITVFLNNQYIVRFTDNELTGGTVALYSGAEQVSAKSGCAFFDVWLWDLDNVYPATPTAVPAIVGTAQIGNNRGEIAIGERDLWTYEGSRGEVLNIRVEADNPVNTRQDVSGLLDTYIVIYTPDGEVLTEADDFDEGIITDSYIRGLSLPEDGSYQIEVRGYNLESGGEYTLKLVREE